MKTGTFQGLTRLTQLGLEHNRMFTVGSASGELPTNLHILELGYNEQLGGARILPDMFKKLSQLQKLRMPHCSIKELTIGMFNNNTRLTLLKLSHNHISTWAPSVFQPLSALKYLFLTSNGITSINKTFFRYLGSLKALDLAGNPLACTCDLVWFKHWLYHKDIDLISYFREENYTCSSPDDMKGVSLRKFSLSPVDCSSKMALYLVTGGASHANCILYTGKPRVP